MVVWREVLTDSCVGCRSSPRSRRHGVGDREGAPAQSAVTRARHDSV